MVGLFFDHAQPLRSGNRGAELPVEMTWMNRPPLDLRGLEIATSSVLSRDK